MIQCFQHRKRCLLLLGLYLYRCGTLNQEVRHVQVAVLDREKESRLPCVVTVVDFEAKLKQKVYDYNVAPGCSPEEGRLPIYIYFL